MWSFIFDEKDEERLLAPEYILFVPSKLAFPSKTIFCLNILPWAIANWGLVHKNETISFDLNSKIFHFFLHFQFYSLNF